MCVDLNAVTCDTSNCGSTCPSHPPLDAPDGIDAPIVTGSPGQL
jgi:hypothetical protein